MWQPVSQESGLARPVLVAVLLAAAAQAGCGSRDAPAPRCDDGARNGDESDVDCGGRCGGCPGGAACLAGADCTSGGCAGGRCQFAIAESCGLDAACLSGFCSDGVCCPARCDGACEACDVDGRVGDCAPVPEGADPDEECALEAAPTCGTTGVCSGDRACARWPAGTACAAASCSEGVSQPVATCDGAGRCLPAAPLACAPFACDAESGACLTTCSGPADCQPGLACAGGACRKSMGAACLAGAECASGACADGVCCDAPCGGPCESCRLGGLVGTCAAVPAGLDPDDECTAEPAATCGRTGACSGARACQLRPAGEVCGQAACDLTLTALYPTDACDGRGQCFDHGTQPCFPYLCDPNRNACRVSCAGDWHCQAGAVCGALGSCDAP